MTCCAISTIALIIIGAGALLYAIFDGARHQSTFPRPNDYADEEF